MFRQILTCSVKRHVHTRSSFSWPVRLFQGVSDILKIGSILLEHAQTFLDVQPVFRLAQTSSDLPKRFQLSGPLQTFPVPFHTFAAFSKLFQFVSNLADIFRNPQVPFWILEMLLESLRTCLQAKFKFLFASGHRTMPSVYSWPAVLLMRPHCHLGWWVLLTFNFEKGTTNRAK